VHGRNLLLLRDDDLLRESPESFVVAISKLGDRHVDGALVVRGHHGVERVLVPHDWLADSTEYDPAIPYFDLTAPTLARVDLPGYGAKQGPRLNLDSSVRAPTSRQIAQGFESPGPSWPAPPAP
jgi:hypothetical protein